jgi:hypothetical protein
MNMTSLCQHCKALIIDEQKVGGQEVKVDGKIVFRFDNNIYIDYDRRDSYPAFPVLGASAAAGCGFCGLLKQTIMARYEEVFHEWLETTQKPIEIIIHKLQYIHERLHKSSGDRRIDGLFLLVVHIIAVSDSDIPWARELDVPFELYADEGMIHTPTVFFNLVLRLCKGTRLRST